MGGKERKFALPFRGPPEKMILTKACLDNRIPKLLLLFICRI